jgi:hypothetical protein
MDLLKIKLKKIANTNRYYCTISFASAPRMKILGDFLREFGDFEGIDSINKLINNFFQTDLTGNSITIDKKNNGKLEISFLYDSEEAPKVEIDPDVLLKAMELYMSARERTPTPEEIIIKFDDTMQNPTVEAVGNLFSSLDK